MFPRHVVSFILEMKHFLLKKTTSWLKKTTFFTMTFIFLLIFSNNRLYHLQPSFLFIQGSTSTFIQKIEALLPSLPNSRYISSPSSNLHYVSSSSSPLFLQNYFSTWQHLFQYSHISPHCTQQKHNLDSFSSDIPYLHHHPLSSLHPFVTVVILQSQHKNRWLIAPSTHTTHHLLNQKIESMRRGEQKQFLDARWL